MGTDTDDWSTTLYLIRHAECAMNPDTSIIRGQAPESPLTERGRKQASALGERFHRQQIVFDRVYASPFQRAMDTAEIMLDAMPQPSKIVLRARQLVEYSAGAWAGKPRVQMYTPDTMRHMGELGMDWRPPEGESLHMVEHRAVDWLLREIVSKGEMVEGLPPHRTFAVVAHALPIKCLLRHILGVHDRMVWRVAIDNTGIAKMRFTAHGWFVDTVNDTAHLDGHGY